MAEADYWFNEPKFISFPKHEFYATGLFADAVKGCLPPGWYATVQIGQIPAKETVNAAYKVADVFSDVDDFDESVYTFGPYDRDDLVNSNITMAGGASRPYELAKTYSIPVVLDPTEGGDPRGSWDRVSGRVTDAYGVGLGVGSEGSSNFGLDYNNMAMLSNLQMLANLERNPATMIRYGNVDGSWIIELPSILFIQMEMFPPDSADIYLSRYMHAGWVAFGHL